MTDTPDRIDAVRVLTRLNRLLETVDSGLTIPQYRVLMALSHGGIRSAMLAERLAVRRPTLTAIADGLVAAGYAVRESEPGDRRVVQLRVTDAGRAALRRADQAYVAKLGPLFDEIAGDRLVADLIAIGEVLDERLRHKIAVPVPVPVPIPEAAEATV
ncbi:MAG TPA: MarR family transcriptional regulator [Micromonosporaceae bacterium]|nr:MarR family transcriptional regulator [Micromonosporaceae bacterium]